jgi:hypothetical protein
MTGFPRRLLLSFCAAAIAASCGPAPSSPSPTPPAGSSSIGFIAVLDVGGAGCVDPEASPRSDYAVGQDAFSVKQGDVVAIYLVEPEEYSIPARPDTFPWSTPVSSDTSVLEPATECTHGPAVRTLATSITVFRAIGLGRALVSASLTPGWSSAPPRCPLGGCLIPPPFAITIDVTQ